MKKFWIITIILLFTYIQIGYSGEKPLFYKIDIKKEIGSTTWRYMQRGYNEAAERNVQGIILHLNTYGGTVVHADSIRTLILNSKIPIYAFIDNNAASAGALIAIACDSIYMRPGANIGAATVVNETGAAMPDKYQSYMRATIRSTAESHGKDTTVTLSGDTVVKWVRDPLIAEAMVDTRIIVPGLVDSTKVLTLTAQEALRWGYSEATVNSVHEIITERIGVPEYTLQTFKPSVYDDLVGFLLNPALQAILIMIIVGGIYFELQTPGIGFPSAAALIAALLYFAPLYLDGLAESWEILIFVAGVILMILELIVIPGFGVTGILGIICMVGGLILALVSNTDFNFEGVTSNELLRSVFTVISGLICAFILMIYITHRIGKKGIFSRLALSSSQAVEKGFVAVSPEYKYLIGKEGRASTVLRPSGKVRIEEDDYDAVSLYNKFIERGTPVRVVRVENAQLYVVTVENEKK